MQAPSASHPFSAPPYPAARLPSHIGYVQPGGPPFPRFYPGPEVQPVFEPVRPRLQPEFQVRPAYRPPEVVDVHRSQSTTPAARQLDTAPFPVTPPLTVSHAQTIALPQALPGGHTEGSAPDSSSERRRLMVKLPLRNTQSSNPDVKHIRESKRKRTPERSEPSLAGADIVQLQQKSVPGESSPNSKEALRTLGDREESPRKRLRSSRTSGRRNIVVARADDSDTPPGPAQAGAAETIPEAECLNPDTHTSPTMLSADVVRHAATELQMLPTPPSEQGGAIPRTPVTHTKASARQFSPGLYGREQPKRRAKREVAAPGPILKRKPSLRPENVNEPTLPQLDGTADRNLPNTRGSKRKRKVQARGRVGAKQGQTNAAVAVQTPEINMGPTHSIPAPAQPPCPTPEYSMPESTVSFRREESGDVRALPDPLGDTEFVKQMIDVLQQQAQSDISNVQKISSTRVLALLKKAKFPAADEIMFLSGEEAKKAVSANAFFNGPIVTAEQQRLERQTVEQFLEEFYEQDAQIWVQDSSTGLARNQAAVRQVKVSQVKERLEGGPTEAPWNCLELATHHDEGLRPSFLQAEDCRLLTKLKIPGAADHTRRRTYPQGYKEVEKWALLAEAGALTTPHQDSHGYSTFITVNFGQVGYGWLSLPTAAERAEWCKHPQTYEGGRWRYIILKPGQTVYFPAGTVHMVFRLPSAGHTLAFGGHILRNSNIVHWVKTLLEERENPNVTNEDLTDSSTGYLDRVEKFVDEAVQRGDTERWGGMESIEEFKRLKMKFQKPKANVKTAKKSKNTRKASAKAA